MMNFLKKLTNTITNLSQNNFINQNNNNILLNNAISFISNHSDNTPHYSTIANLSPIKNNSSINSDIIWCGRK